MTDTTTDLVKRLLRAKGSELMPKILLGHKNAEIACLEAAARIEELERELAEALDGLNVEMNNTLYHIDQLDAEKALADRRGAMLMQIEAAIPLESFGLGNSFAEEVEAEVESYRKARGM